jgi:hypothetical protein
MRPVSLAPFSTLTPFPFAPPQPDGLVRLLEANVVRTIKDVLHFQYRLDANLSRIRVPARRMPQQVDELWKHTCFEAFIARADSGSSQDYCELNFSPSTEWAAYSFSGYRQGMTPIAMPIPPDIRIEATAAGLCLHARIDVRHLFAADEPGASYRIALAAVIESDDGALSYWALKHAPSKPDFHHPSGFILEV